MTVRLSNVLIWLVTDAGCNFFLLSVFLIRRGGGGSRVIGGGGKGKVVVDVSGI